MSSVGFAGRTKQVCDQVASIPSFTWSSIRVTARALDFYTRLFSWHAETVELAHTAYLSLKLGDGIEGGIAKHDGEGSMWLPYVEVVDVAEATQRARGLGATVLLGPSEGPAGWRSILGVPAGARIALWQPKI
jgi:predicted enzyme related to lactoylglutathione lyase